MILSAAVDCVQETGLRGATTLAVQERAGVSRGALLHYFPTHATLMEETIAELLRLSREVVASALAGVESSDDPLVDMIGALVWAAREPVCRAELDLWAAARTDPGLRSMLTAAQRASRRDIDRKFAERIVAWRPEDSNKQDVMGMTACFIRGVAMADNLGATRKNRDQLIRRWADCMRFMLDGPDKSGASTA